MIDVSHSHLQALCASRKMELSDVVDAEQVAADRVLFADLEAVHACATRLKYAPALLLEGCDALQGHDAPAAVVARSGSGFKRTSQRGGRDYYTYEHLATSPAVPQLMALRVDLHCDTEEDLVMNPGHEKSEVNYVESGQVRYFWDEKSGERHSADLQVGDSIVVAPYTPHSCVALEPNSRILSINF